MITQHVVNALLALSIACNFQISLPGKSSESQQQQQLASAGECGGGCGESEHLSATGAQLIMILRSRTRTWPTADTVVFVDDFLVLFFPRARTRMLFNVKRVVASLARGKTLSRLSHGSIFGTRGTCCLAATLLRGRGMSRLRLFDLFSLAIRENKCSQLQQHQNTSGDEGLLLVGHS